MSEQSENTHGSPPVVVSLGSNIKPERNLPAAIDLLKSSEHINVINVSQVWESAPLGFADQAPFCNAAVLIQTDLPPLELKNRVLRQIERQLFRIRDPENKNGPRTIDLDIGLFGDELHDSEQLQIPDPDLTERSFLAVTFAELIPHFVLPTWEVSLAQLAEKIKDSPPLTVRSDIDLKQCLRDEFKRATHPRN